MQRKAFGEQKLRGSLEARNGHLVVPTAVRRGNCKEQDPIIDGN